MPEEGPLTIEQLGEPLPEGGRGGRPDRLELLFKIIGALITFSAVAWGVISFNIEHKDEAEKLQKQQETEVKAPFRQRQMELYIEVCDCTSKIATLDTKDPARRKAYDRFLQLVVGPLCVVESERVEKSAIEFYTFAVRIEDSLDGRGHLTLPNRLNYRKLSRQLAKACRAELGKEWDVVLPQLQHRAELDGKESNSEASSSPEG